MAKEAAQFIVTLAAFRGRSVRCTSLPAWKSGTSEATCEITDFSRLILAEKRICGVPNTASIGSLISPEDIQRITGGEYTIHGLRTGLTGDGLHALSRFEILKLGDRLSRPLS